MSEIKWPVEAAPCCYGNDMCVCTDMEQACRAWADGFVMPPMTALQREACLQEIGRTEGLDLREFAGLPDSELATGVLVAWADFARDKGLL